MQQKKPEKMIWKNLRTGKCPKCGNGLKQRKMPSNPYSSLSFGSGTRDNPMIYCPVGGCTFSIRRDAMDSLVRKLSIRLK